METTWRAKKQLEGERSRNRPMNSIRQLLTQQPKKNKKLILIKFPITRQLHWKKPVFAKSQSRNHSLDYGSLSTIPAHRPNSSYYQCYNGEYSNKSFKTYSNQNVSIKRRLSSQHHHRNRQPSLESVAKDNKSSISSDYSTRNFLGEYSQKCFEEGKVALAKKDYKNAAPLFDKAFKADSNKIEALLYKGIVLMDSNLLSEAIKVLNKVTKTRTCKAKPAYLLLAMAYRKNNQIESAIGILNEALKQYPTSLDALISRANLFVEKRLWEEARKDFGAVVKLDKKAATGYLGLSECEYNLGNPKAAITAYHHAIQLGAAASISTSLKILNLEVKLGEYEAAHKDVEEILKAHPTMPEALMVKGKIMQKLSNPNEAAINYEQAAKYGTPETAALALFKLSKLRVRQKDFYEALFNIKRIQLQPLPKKVEYFANFVDGIVSIIRKKTKAGLKLLAKIEPDIHQQKGDIQIMFYLFKGYGCMIKRQFESAYKCYEKAEKVDESSKYNKLICEGVLRLKEKDYSSALCTFSKATTLFPKNKSGYAYRCLTNPKELEKADSELQAILPNFQEDADIFFYKALLELSKHHYLDSYQYFSSSLKYVDEITPKHYFFRAFSAACTGMLNEAIGDLDIALTLDSNYSDACFLKGKCAYLAGDVESAFKCYKQLIETNAQEASAHIHIGNLLMINGEFEDAAKAYANAIGIKATPAAHYQLSKCLILLGNAEDAIKELKQAIEIRKNKVMTRDLRLLKLVQDEMDGREVNYAKNEALFNEMLNQLQKEGEGILFNARFEGKKDDYCKIDTESVYRYPIFEAEDLLAYRAIMRTYLDKYIDALEDLRTLHKALELYKRTYFDSENDLSVAEDLEKEINDLRLSPMSLNECNEIEEAVNLIEDLAKVLDEQDLKWVKLIKLLINHAKTGESLEDYEYFRNNTSSDITISSTNICIAGLIHKSKLSSRYPYLTITLGQYTLKIQPIFSYPVIRPMNLAPTAGNFVLTQLSPMMVPCAPEPPWIKRCSYGIKFTDDIQVLDSISSRGGEKETDTVKSR